MSSNGSGEDLCIVCGRSIIGLRHIRVLNAGICEPCEQRLVNARPDSPDYDGLVQSLKQIWQGMPLEPVDYETHRA